MQKIATKIFILASITFGITGIILVITATGPDQADTPLTKFLTRFLMANVFVILSSFALSIAGKYLSSK
ncbi:hypothetical protein KBD87_00390 [Candidatus Saccharibacteria bacterium]|nr:hypothetical protein [Candidatus Saccharibacteria bacterium]